MICTQAIHDSHMVQRWIVDHSYNQSCTIDIGNVIITHALRRCSQTHMTLVHVDVSKLDVESLLRAYACEFVKTIPHKLGHGHYIGL